MSDVSTKSSASQTQPAPKPASLNASDSSVISYSSGPKECSTCKVIKDPSEFKINGSKKDGTKYTTRDCKSCRRKKEDYAAAARVHQDSDEIKKHKTDALIALAKANNDALIRI